VVVMGKKSRRNKPSKERMPFVARTFAGLPNEADWVALREFVPSATAVVQLTDGTKVRICSLVPGAGAGLVRPDGEIWVGLQVMHNHGDISRDLAHVVELAKQTPEGTPIKMTDPGVGPRLDEIVDAAGGFELELHDDFNWWLQEADRQNSAAVAALEEANASVAPTTKLGSVQTAYLTDMGDHTYLRWIMPQDEDCLLDALARLRAAGEDSLTDGTVLIGIFRAHGLLAPVWEVVDVAAADLDKATADFAGRLEQALTLTAELTTAERTSRRELNSRQVTIR